MLHLFRKIRSTLLAEGKTSNYLKYAIGEIILVVIGILIALQINNWNETRKSALQERQLLDNLSVEFQDNLKDLDSISLKVDKVIMSLEKVFDLFSFEQSNRPLDSVDIWFSKALESPNWKPSEYLLNSLHSSGTIAEFKNERLKLLLYKWSRQHNEMIEVQSRTEKTGEEIIAHLKTFGSLRNVDVAGAEFNYRRSTLTESNAFLLLDSRLENHIDDKLYMYKVTKKWLNNARATLIQLIEETER